TLSFHPLVQRDFNEIIAYYETQATPEVADRFEAEFRAAVACIKASPRHFPYYLNQRRFRRCRLSTFPHLILYRETTAAIRIMVLKHVKRAPSHGLSRR
ncbi:MAG: type II toxin-antitoxin system RelE/ParE family toxin, partial [Verrucomicrobia bacterium]|nr:type II toxin-antitoxin system RelE/ParE family toxin [Verrucomicrobiota bacterium]